VRTLPKLRVRKKPTKYLPFSVKMESAARPVRQKAFQICSMMFEAESRDFPELADSLNHCFARSPQTEDSHAHTKHTLESALKDPAYRVLL
jgi:hypothetical protein